MVALSPSQATPVKVTTIDELLRRLSVANVDVVKMDIEGAESAARLKARTRSWSTSYTGG